jgi:hypothetical protein
MDENAFRHAKGEINRLPCVFERVLLAKHAVCEYAVRHQIGERETIACAQPAARVTCGELNGLLREKSAFALKLAQPNRILPHAMLMKIQCGGLNGLRDLLDADAPAPNVHHLVRLAQQQHGELTALPFGEIVKGVAAWQGRRRHRPRGEP